MAPHFLLQLFLPLPFAKESIHPAHRAPLSQFLISDFQFLISIPTSAPPSDRPSSPAARGYSMRGGLPYRERTSPLRMKLGRPGERYRACLPPGESKGMTQADRVRRQ